MSAMDRSVKEAIKMVTLIVWDCEGRTDITDDGVVAQWNDIEKKHPCHILYFFKVEKIERKGDRVTLHGEVIEDGR